MNYFQNVNEFYLQLKKDHKKLVFTNGCFDVLHVGHIRYLQESKSLGDYLVIGLNSDLSVKRLKGNLRPVNNQNNRAEVLLALESVDFVVLFEEDTPFQLISSIKPDVLTKGGDYQKEDIVGSKVVESNGGVVKIIPFVSGHSSSNIINKLST